MKHEVNPKEVIEVLKEARAFIQIIQKYRLSPGFFKCGFDELVDIFETTSLINEIENVLTGFGVIFDIDVRD